MKKQMHCYTTLRCIPSCASLVHKNLKSIEEFLAKLVETNKCVAWDLAWARRDLTRLPSPLGSSGAIIVHLIWYQAVQ